MDFCNALQMDLLPEGGGGEGRGGEGGWGVPYTEAGLLKIGIKFLYKNKWACNRDEGL